MKKLPPRQKYAREEATFGFYGLLILLGLFLAVFYSAAFILLLIAGLAFLLGFQFMPLILVLLPAYLPFQIALNPSVDIDLASGRLIIAGLTLIFILKIVLQRKAWFPLSHFSLALTFFLLWSSLSFFSADDTGRFFRKILVFFSLCPIFFLASAYLKKIESWQKLFKYWVFSSFIVACLGFGQFIFQFIASRELFFKFWGKFVAPILYGTNAGEAIASNPSWFVGIAGTDFLRAIGTFPDPHMLAFYLGMSLPLQIAYIITQQQRKFWPLVGISFMTLILTFSRGSYVGLAGIFLWLIGFFFLLQRNPAVASKIQNWREKIKINRLLLALLLIGSLSLSIAPFRDRFLSIFNLDEGSNQGRLDLWSEALETSLYNPLLGVGLGNFSNFIRPESKYREPIYAHNTYLDLASEIGLPGVLAWIFLLFLGLKPLFPQNAKHLAKTIFGRINCREQKQKRIIAIWNVASALAIFWFALHCLFETPIFSPQILPLFLYLIAFRGFYEIIDYRL